MWAEDKVRIIDIAEELGVSTATVSNVIHGKTKKISSQTVKRVQEKLQERGYLPNMAATLLAQNNSRIIGVVIKDHEKYNGHLLEDPFIAASLNFLADAMEENGYLMMVKKAKDIREAVKFASMWNMDGMVILSFCSDEYQQLRDSIRIPFVVYDGYFCNQGRICNLRIDDRDGGRQIGRHFRDLGHKAVLCVADNRECMDWERYEGLCEGLGFTADFMQLPIQKTKREEFYHIHFSQFCRYSAVFAVSDVYGAELLGFLQKSGVKIPEEISLAGFDGSSICQQVLPSLTSVRQDGQRRAQIAVKLLEKMKKEPAFFGDFFIPVQLVVQESTGPARLKDD